MTDNPAGAIARTRERLCEDHHVVSDADPDVLLELVEYDTPARCE